MNRVQDIQIEVWKYKDVECLEIQIAKVGTCSFCFYMFVLCNNYIVLSKLGSIIKKTFAIFDFNKHLKIN